MNSILKRAKLLGIHLEGKQNFDFYMRKLIEKANKECHTVARVCNHMNLNKRRSKINTFIISKFSSFLSFLFCLDAS